MCVTIRPGSTAAYRAVILGLEDLGEDQFRFGTDEGFGHESNLVMYCLVLAAGSDMDRSCTPSVFQATTLDSQRAAGRISFIVAIISEVQAERPVSSTTAVRIVEQTMRADVMLECNNTRGDGTRSRARLDRRRKDVFLAILLLSIASTRSGRCCFSEVQVSCDSRDAPSPLHAGSTLTISIKRVHGQ